MATLGSAIPILRIFDEEKAIEFYCGFLGLKTEFEHRFDAEAPLYIGLSLGEFRLHLTGHHGDTTPGTRIYVPVKGLVDYAKELRGRSYVNCRPGAPERTGWGTIELTVTDPFGNRLTFAEPV